MIEAQLKKWIGDFEVDAHFSAGDSMLTALFGRSGCGKTSIINMISGLLTPDSGYIRTGDKILFDSISGVNIKPERRRIGYVFQEGRLFPHMSVRKNLLYGAKTHGDSQLSLSKISDLLGIGHILDRKPSALSGGEQQRVAIGRALLSNPRLLLMDEPLASLDTARKQEILPFLERLRDEVQIPLIYVSHAMEEVLRLADTMVLLDNGSVAATGSVEELTSRLDLKPLTGRYEAGSVFTATVQSHDDRYHLTELDIAGGRIHVGRLNAPPGRHLRIRIKAKDVILTTEEPYRISTLNRLQGTISKVSPANGPNVDVLIDIGAPLWARVTQKSVDTLGIVPGRPIYALIKSVAIDRHSFGNLS